MNFQQFKVLILTVTAVSALMVASPALQQFIVAPQTETLTELALYGPYHNGTYPSGIAENMTNKMYIDVTNRLGSAAYYQIQIKFRNVTQSGPDSFNKTSSSLPAIGTMSFVVANQKTVELPVDFSFQAKLDEHLDGLLHMEKITVNGEAINVYATTIRWDFAKDGFYGNLVFELWKYNDSKPVNGDHPVQIQ